MSNFYWLETQVNALCVSKHSLVWVCVNVHTSDPTAPQFVQSIKIPFERRHSLPTKWRIKKSKQNFNLIKMIKQIAHAEHVEFSTKSTSSVRHWRTSLVIFNFIQSKDVLLRSKSKRKTNTHARTSSTNAKLVFVVFSAFCLQPNIKSNATTKKNITKNSWVTNKIGENEMRKKDKKKMVLVQSMERKWRRTHVRCTETRAFFASNWQSFCSALSLPTAKQRDKLFSTSQTKLTRTHQQRMSAEPHVRRTILC